MSAWPVGRSGVGLIPPTARGSAGAGVSGLGTGVVVGSGRPRSLRRRDIQLAAAPTAAIAPVAGPLERRSEWGSGLSSPAAGRGSRRMTDVRAVSGSVESSGFVPEAGGSDRSGLAPFGCGVGVCGVGGFAVPDVCACSFVPEGPFVLAGPVVLVGHFALAGGVVVLGAAADVCEDPPVVGASSGSRMPRLGRTLSGVSGISGPSS
ncbi:hypothetical protein GCM10027418_25040 [Mariniluteicoccus endophyticus]